MIAPLALVAAAVLAAPIDTPHIDPNSPVSKAEGWKLYSGPDAASLWKVYQKGQGNTGDFPKQGWVVDSGELRQVPPGGGDIVTKAQFHDFEIITDFKLDAKANSGILWRVTDKFDASYESGPEYQLLEDHTYTMGDGKLISPTDPHSTAALYDLYTPAPGKVLNPTSEWNTARIYLRNGVIQHWLNGKKIVEARIADDEGKPTSEWTSKIAASKFKGYEGFGISPKGGIALQDHGGGVAFRNTVIRDLDAPRPGEVALYNGKDLTGWEPIVPDAAKAGIKPADVWSVKDGILICKGNPLGYIRTTKDYTNYILRVVWRFNPVTKEAGNSGVLLRMIGQDKVWPKSIEAQLQSGEAGDFWNIDQFKMTVAKDRTNGRNTRRTHTTERAIGEWNEYEIVVDHHTITLYVNGEELNQATDVEEVPGKICLQSEGAEIQFKSVLLTPLP